jgi:hypothetical protein
MAAIKSIYTVPHFLGGTKDHKRPCQARNPQRVGAVYNGGENLYLGRVGSGE